MRDGEIPDTRAVHGAPRPSVPGAMRTISRRTGDGRALASWTGMISRRLVGLVAATLLFPGWGCGGRVGEGASPDAGTRPDGGAGTTPASCIISASDYDQSCKVDGDCAGVTSGNYCMAGCLCGGSAINVSALPQFNAAVAATPLGSGALGGTGCPCPDTMGPCCRHGTCTDDCFSAGDTLAACADAGGTCYLTSCSPAGPPGSCAFADETCCL
jgi:hypothetical protein